MADRAAWWWLTVLVAVGVLLPWRWSIPLVTVLAVGAAGSRWWVRRAGDGIEVSCSAPRWASPDQGIVARVEVVNRSRLPVAWAELDVPFAVGLGRSVPHREAVAVEPRGSLVRQLELMPTHRGRYHLGPPQVRVGDVFGAGSMVVTAPERTEVTVFPRIVALDQLGLPAHSPFVTLPSPHALLTDPVSVAGVRDYQRGDPLSAVHWPATARTGDLAVKHYERAEARETVVCLDLDPRGYPRGRLQAGVELAIVVAASVMHHAIVNDQLPAGLVTAAWDPRAAEPALRLPARSDRDHLRRMLELLAVAQPSGCLGLAELLAGLGDLGAGTTVLAVGGRLDEATIGQLMRLSREGVAVAAALTVPVAAGDPRSVNARVPVHRIAEVPDVTLLSTRP